MKLYGTTTSPFVRRVRAVAAEVGQPLDLIIAPPDQAALHEVSPIRKVPVAVIDERSEPPRTIYDSRAIVDWLTTTRGWGTLAPPVDRWREQNLVNAIDTALESIIQLFYLRRDGVPVAGSPYEARQVERAGAIFTWLATQLAPDRRSFTGGFGLAELSLICTLDWMDFRQTYPTAELSALAPLRAAWNERPALVATRPHA